MDKWERLIEYAFILFLIIILDLIVFGPIIENVVELGLNNEMTVGGVTAPVKDLLDPIVLNLYKLMWHILDISGWFSLIWFVLKKFKIT